MNIEGLDYNTQREKLVMPEYGREVQNMVDYAMTLESKQERQRCANTIIKVMGQMVPKNKESIDHERKLWDHLAIMSGFKLDIDYPYDVSGALKIATKPEPMEYPMQKIPVRHYGKMMFELFEKLKTMPAGKERDQLTRLTANQMKHNLSQWGHGSNDDEKIASDLARFTDGVIQLDLATFKFDTQYQQKQPVQPQQSKKRKRK
ncbi:MAG: DUF4290 domain-containing protein [Prevotella sp.]|jgi:hypothetical protein|nr:DUF4290 domain-containing protein [Prevotella sp.]